MKLFYRTLIFAPLVALVASFVIYKQTHTQLKADFIEEVSVSESVLGIKKDLFIEGLSHISQRLEGLQDVNRENFQKLIQNSWFAQKENIALAWLPKVEHDSRNALVDAEKASGVLDFNIRERSQDDSLIVASKRNEYFPILQILPEMGSKEELGFDFSSQIKYLRTIEEARDTGDITASVMEKGFLDRNGSFDFFVFAPVYTIGSLNTESVSEKRKGLKGFLLGVFSLDGYIQGSISTALKNGLNLQVFDGRESEVDRVYGLPLESPIVERISEFNIAGRVWKLHWAVNPTYASGAIAYWALLACFLFVCFALTASYYYSSLAKKKVYLQEELKEKSLALKETNRILEKERSEKEIAEQVANRASQVKGEFLSNMSHEIRTPMNAILGFTNILLEEVKDKGRVKFLRGIGESAKGLLDLINDILDFSKIESGMIDLEISEFNLHQNIESIINLFDHMASTKGVNLTYEISPGVPRFIISDSTRLRQVVANLVNNAIKFTEPGGDVRVLVSGIEDENRFHLEISVEDTGIGIPQEHIPKLFNRFTQADGSHSRKHSGVGLGLSICKNLIELLGGKITVGSIEGKLPKR